VNKKLMPALLVLPCLPFLAQAEAYKCRQPNGTLAFQDHPCQNGASGSKVTLAPVQGYTAVPLGQSSSGGGSSSGSGSSSGGAATGSSGGTAPAAAGNSRAEQLQRLNADNDKLQAEAAKMRADNPNWEKSQTLSRLNAEADNAKADNPQTQ
jgi:hypothetical protein